MARSVAQDSIPLFNVVGAAYVAERHAGDHNPFVAYPPARRAGTSFAASWVVLVTLVAAISICAGEVSVLANVGLSNDIPAIAIE